MLYYSSLVFFAGRLLKDPDEANDLVHDVFVTLWHKRQDFNSEESIKAFLYIATKNACYNKLKAAQRLSDKQFAFIKTLPEADQYVLEEIIRAEVFGELHALLRILPPECRKIFLMRLSDLDNKEIAEQLKLSIATVKNQFSRGLGLLRKKLKDRPDLLMIVPLLFHETIQLTSNN